MEEAAGEEHESRGTSCAVGTRLSFTHSRQTRFGVLPSRAGLRAPGELVQRMGIPIDVVLDDAAHACALVGVEAAGGSGRAAGRNGG